MVMGENQKLDKFIMEYFDEEDRHSPTSATSIGIHQYDSELEDFSSQGIEGMKQRLHNHERTFSQINYDELDHDGKIKYHLMNQKSPVFPYFHRKDQASRKGPGTLCRSCHTFGVHPSSARLCSS
jgi:uncharacterized protein (DUF885 family)